MYNLKDYDYNLPPELIATEPAKKRDQSRLLVLDKESGGIEHKHFFDIVDYLRNGDVLVLNNSKVIPARLIGKKKGSGGKVEIFLHKRGDKSSLVETPPIETRRGASLHVAFPPDGAIWEVLIGGKRIAPGQIVEFENGLIAEVIKNNNDGTWLVRFNLQMEDFVKIIEEIGEVPLPPYIKKEIRVEGTDDKKSYQTVYADETKAGSVAAPTAGLHFTPELLAKLKDKGVQIEYVTLHVGLGTFSPVKADDIRDHKMHEEFVEIDKEAADRILKAKQEKRRIIAVGTTSTRTLEAALGKALVKSQLSKVNCQTVNCYSERVNIFIYPGYEFKIVDAMITNFHLPKSSLIMLVSALAGKENIDKAYAEAIKEKYRFYSYGDAMFIS